MYVLYNIYSAHAVRACEKRVSTRENFPPKVKIVNETRFECELWNFKHNFRTILIRHNKKDVGMSILNTFLLKFKSAAKTLKNI